MPPGVGTVVVLETAAREVAVRGAPGAEVVVLEEPVEAEVLVAVLAAGLLVTVTVEPSSTWTVPGATVVERCSMTAPFRNFIT
jgi:hypothetical protein